MSDLEFPDDVEWTVESVEDALMDTEHSSPVSDEHWLCDWCSKGTSYQGGCEGWHYMADDVLGDLPDARLIHEKRPLTTLAAYCTECGNERLFFPAEGYTEVRVYFELDEDHQYETVEVTDISPRDDGIPWNPKEVAERITQERFEDVAMLGDELWAPENMVTVFLSADIDIRDLVNYEGEINEKKLGSAREKWRQFQQEQAKHGMDRQHFRDSVRDN